MGEARQLICWEIDMLTRDEANYIGEEGLQFQAGSQIGRLQLPPITGKPPDLWAGTQTQTKILNNASWRMYEATAPWIKFYAEKKLMPKESPSKSEIGLDKKL